MSVGAVTQAQMALASKIRYITTGLLDVSSGASRLLLLYTSEVPVIVWEINAVNVTALVDTTATLDVGTAADSNAIVAGMALSTIAIDTVTKATLASTLVPTTAAYTSFGRPVVPVDTAIYTDVLATATSGSVAVCMAYIPLDKLDK